MGSGEWLLRSDAVGVLVYELVEVELGVLFAGAVHGGHGVVGEKVGCIEVFEHVGGLSGDGVGYGWVCDVKAGTLGVIFDAVLCGGEVGDFCVDWLWWGVLLGVDECGDGFVGVMVVLFEVVRLELVDDAASGERRKL